MFPELAALAVHHGQAYPAFDDQREAAFDGSLDAVLATAVGYHCYEGMGLITKA